MLDHLEELEKLQVKSDDVRIHPVLEVILFPVKGMFEELVQEPDQDLKLVVVILEEHEDLRDQPVAVVVRAR